MVKNWYRLGVVTEQPGPGDPPPAALQGRNRQRIPPVMRVAVVGSGPAGCAAAIALCRAGLDVFLVGDGLDGVGEQLDPAARPLLARLGLERLPGQLDCVGVRAAWHSPELEEQHFLSHPFGNGWLLDRARFGETLRQAAVAAGAVLRIPARLTGIARESTAPHGWRLRLSDGEEACDWLVDATGRRGACTPPGRQAPALRRQVALVGWLATDRGRRRHPDRRRRHRAGGTAVAAGTTPSRASCRVPARRETWESRGAPPPPGPAGRWLPHRARAVMRAADSTIIEHCFSGLDRDRRRRGQLRSAAREGSWARWPAGSRQPRSWRHRGAAGHLGRLEASFATYQAGARLYA
jgi:2-polyprenyl-6-methoxyphenol hydroxylase-like FAD-dependent oxidoreductase